MRHTAVLLLAAGCGFESSKSLDQLDELVTEAVSFNAADDFAAPGHTVSAMTIEARGSLTPDAYTYGGLAVRSLRDTKLWMHGAVSWAALDPVMPAGAGLWRGEPITIGSGLEYLGVMGKPREVTLWFEGEVWLEAGVRQQFELHGDDVAFIDLARPGSASYTALSENRAEPFDVAVPVTGWYPIRVGFADGDASGGFSFLHADGDGPAIAWTRDRMRTRASALQGTLRTVFGRQLLGGGAGQSRLPVSILDDGDLLEANDFDADPPVVGMDDWSARYAGQLYAPEPGKYALRITSDDGNRGRLGSAIAQMAWQRGIGVGVNPAVTTFEATLAAGWNDISVDYNEVGGASELEIALQGPGDASFVAVPRARLRPVEPADDRIATGSDDTEREVDDNGGPAGAATATVAFAGGPGETVTAIDVTYEVDSMHWSQIQIDLEAPATVDGPGARGTIREHSSDFGGNEIFQRTISQATPVDSLKALLGGRAGGAWKLHVYDDVNGMGNRTRFKSAKITLHTAGGLERIARAASWTSKVLDTGTSVRAIDGATWDARLPDGASLEVRVATCRQPDCSDAAWSQPVEMATPLDAPAGRYLQLRVDMTSDGVLEPELRSLVIQYRRDPG
jgi:subtilisin-like proprotein convertase family protein